MDSMVNILVIDMTALRIMVKYVVKARIFPTSEVPAFTRKAPVRITPTRPRFSRMLTEGSITAMTIPFFFSLRATSALMLLNFSVSKPVLDNAFITRIPAISSLTIRTNRSMASCNAPNIGILRRDTAMVISASSGRAARSTQAIAQSRVKVTRMPPSSKMGALTPSLWTLPRA